MLGNVTLGDIEDYINSRPNEEDIRVLCEGETGEVQELFDLAKKICDFEYISHKQLNALAEIATYLAIDSEKTGFSFDIYSDEERKRFEFNRIVLNFSIINSSISFFPFSPVNDFLFTTPIQIIMVNSISNLYSFKLDGLRFVKVIATSAGLNLISRIFSGVLSTFLPFKWAVRASLSFASTYAVGILAKAYIDSNGELEEDNLKEMFSHAFDEGKVVFEEFKEYIKKNKDVIVEDFKKNWSKENS